MSNFYSQSRFFSEAQNVRRFITSENRLCFLKINIGLELSMESKQPSDALITQESDKQADSFRCNLIR